MKHISSTLLLAAAALAALSACGGGAPDELDAQAVEQTAQAFMAAARAAEETATAAAIEEAPPPVEGAPPVEEVPPGEAPPTATATLSEFELKLAAAATAQAPTIQAGQTLAAQTQAALPTSTPLVFEVLSSTTNETIVENGVEITVTAIVPPSQSLAQAWTEVYAAPEGVPFTITTDEEAMALAIENSMTAAGVGQNVSNIDVSLNNNLITVSFTVTIGGVSADGRASFKVFVQDGKAVTTMVSLQFGRFNVPTEILDALNVAIAQALTGANDASQAQVTISDISIDNGEMIIRGIVGIEGP